MKLLVSPLTWYLPTVLLGLLLLRRSNDGGSRRIANGLILLTLLVALGSTRLFGALLEHSLRVDRTSFSGSRPEFIFVLAGGYQAGNSPREDVLNTYTAERLRHGVNEWQSNRGARLVLSGSMEIASLRHARNLVARATESYGLPDSVLLLETHSRNTREHPVEALRLPGVTPATHVAVVTSSWHMRRARGEFCRYFERVDVYPVPLVERTLALSDVVPLATRLVDNTMRLREWFGIVWYGVRGIGEDAVGDC